MHRRERPPADDKHVVLSRQDMAGAVVFEVDPAAAGADMYTSGTHSSPAGRGRLLKSKTVCAGGHRPQADLTPVQTSQRSPSQRLPGYCRVLWFVFWHRATAFTAFIITMHSFRVLCFRCRVGLELQHRPPTSASQWLQGFRVLCFRCMVGLELQR